MQTVVSKYKVQVESADILLFLSACLSGTHQSTYYAEATDIQASLQFLHAYICINYRQIYTAAMGLEINHHNQQRIILNLLKNPDQSLSQSARAEENAVIKQALQTMPVHRVYKLFVMIANSHINNRRTRATIKAYLQWRNNLIFDLVKYRRLMRIITRHVHLKLTAEMHVFLHDRHWQKRKFETPLFEHFRQAHYSAQALSHLPFTVAEGLASRFNLSRAQLFERMQGNMTAHEKLRVQNQTAQAKVKLEIDPEKISLTRLLAYVYSLPESERKQRLPELTQWITRCQQRFQCDWLRFSKLALVIDNSQSSRGARETWLRPLIAGISAHYVLESMSQSYRLIWLSTPEHPLLARAEGQTNLALPFLEALEWGAEEIVLISDGAENDPAGGTHWLLEQVKKKSWAGKLTQMLHCNPTVSPEDFGPSSLSPHLPMLGLHEGERLPLNWILGRFAAGQVSLPDFHQYLRRATHAAMEANATF